MRKHILRAIQAHAAAEYPKECCGLLLAVGRKQQYYSCRNIAADPGEEFRIDPEDYAAAEDLGEVIGIVHSHPDATSRPSPHDLAMCEATELPWHIISWPEGDLRSITPTGSTPLLNRPFVHGAWDCWQVCADWYKRELGLEFEAFKREDGWWESADAASLYEANYEAAGFVRVDHPQRGDMIVMEVGRTVHPNHAGIFLGSDPALLGEEVATFGPGPFLLHHLYGRPSEVIVFGGPWLDRTRLILRHKMHNQPHDAAGSREMRMERIDPLRMSADSILRAVCESISEDRLGASAVEACAGPARLEACPQLEASQSAFQPQQLGRLC